MKGGGAALGFGILGILLWEKIVYRMGKVTSGGCLDKNEGYTLWVEYSVKYSVIVMRCISFKAVFILVGYF